MIYFKLFFITFLLFTFSTNSNEVQVIELHQNKSLDQLVLEKENDENLQIPHKKKGKFYFVYII